MLQTFGIIAGILSLATNIPYLRDIFRRKTKPERATWFIWSVLNTTAFFSQLAEGASHSLWLNGVQAAGVIIIFLLSIKLGVGGFSRWDVSALIASGFGLVLWYFTNNAAIALFITIIIGAIGALLTIHKAYVYPDSETMSAWLLAGTAGIFAAISVGTLDYVLLIFPMYIIISNYLVAAAMILGRRK